MKQMPRTSLSLSRTGISNRQQRPGLTIIDSMKKALTQLLALLLLMPSLVCGMSVCPTVEQEAALATGRHCGGEPPEGVSKQTDAIMWFSDCMGVDIQPSTLSIELDEPSFLPDLTEVAGVGDWAISPMDYRVHGGIRGSPGWRGRPSTQEPLYLSTRRIRI